MHLAKLAALWPALPSRPRGRSGMNNASKYLMTRWPLLIYFTPFNLYFYLFCLNDDFRIIAARARSHGCQPRRFSARNSSESVLSFFSFGACLAPSVEEQFRHENKQQPSRPAIKEKEEREATHSSRRQKGRTTTQQTLLLK